MAKITVLLGELSGSIAGNTFSRNKAGAYVRQRVTPTDAKSEAQMRVRGAFSLTSAAFHAMTPTQKSNWNAFANSLFKPRDGRIAGVTYTGQQAFVALNQQLRNAAERVNAGFESYSVGGTTSSAYQPFPSAVLEAAPVENFSGNLTSGAGSLSQSFNGVSFNANTGQLILSMGFGGVGVGIEGSPTAPTWTDPSSGDPTGYLIFGSEPVEQEGLAPVSIYKNLLASVRPPTTFTGTYSAASSFTIETAAQNSTAPRKSWYLAGQTIRVTVFAVNSRTGQTQLIGSLDTVVA